MKNNNSITTSAPGKLLVMGDHAVVYGYPCIVTAINERMYATVSIVDSTTLSIDAPDVGVSGYLKSLSDLGDGTEPKGVRFIEFAVKNFIAKYAVSDGISIVTRSEFSSTLGFGSSSACIVSVLYALFCLYERTDNKALFELAYKTVHDVQGAGSGFDVASAMFGGTLYYSKLGQIIEPVGLQIPLIVGYSGTKADTTEMIQSVAKKQKENSQKVERIFSAIGTLVDDAKIKIEEGEWDRVGTLMKFNQEYLRDLGVSTEKLETLIKAVSESGAYGSKLSGAGGGDCMIALVSEGSRDAVIASIKSAGGVVIPVVTGEEGMRIETTDNQNEQLIVVDKNDEILEYASRATCHSNPSLIHRTVGVLLFDTQGRVLLQKRSRTKDMDAGLWGISAAGHVTKGQTDEEAAHRELLEEVGVDTDLEYVEKIFIQNEKESERAVLFKGVHAGPFAINEEEVEKVEWMDGATIRNSTELVFTDGAKKALQIVGVLP